MGGAKSMTSTPWILESDSKEEWIRWKERFLKYCGDDFSQKYTTLFFYYTGSVGEEILKKMYFGDMKNETAISTLIFKFDVYFNYRGVLRYENQTVDEYITRLMDRIKPFEDYNFQEITREKVLQDWKSESIFGQLLNLPAYNSSNRNYEKSSLDELVHIWNYVESVNGANKISQTTKQTAQNLDSQSKKTEVQTSSKRNDLDTKPQKYIETRIPIKHMKISANSKGHGYDSIFGSYLSDKVTSIRIEEPYLMEFYQIQNFLRFCELALKRCQSLSRIRVVTRRDPVDENEQMMRLEELGASLAENRVYLEIQFSETVHDRQIILSTGCIIKIGRGLHYFQRSSGNLSVGFYDLDLRPCLETFVDIFQQQQTKK